jgi:hypothetical protein
MSAQALIADDRTLVAEDEGLLATSILVVAKPRA